MNAQHTPGPWAKIGASVANASTRKTIAVAVGCDGNSGEEEANARLIAAAPELLEALEAFLRAPSVGSGGPGSSTIVVQDFNLRAARAAIAKATGQ